MSENSTYLDDLYKTKTIPANPDGTYFTFDKYDTASPGKLQVPHDASIRGEFDTLQIIDDISIPYGRRGQSDILEPITETFSKYGEGGATQAITRSSIRLDDIQKLP